jgi:hypothetical protein
MLKKYTSLATSRRSSFTGWRSAPRRSWRRKICRALLGEFPLVTFSGWCRARAVVPARCTADRDRHRSACTGWSHIDPARQGAGSAPAAPARATLWWGAILKADGSGRLGWRMT